MNLSSAHTGFFDGDYRVGAIYRSQWQSVPVKYNTFSVNVEKVIKPRDFIKDKFGLGIILNNDRAGDASYGYTQAYLTGSYHKASFKDSTIAAGVGLGVGWCNVGFDVTKMTFDNQFDGLAFSKGISSGEKFSWTSRNFLDLNVGGIIRKNFGSKDRVTYSLGVFHLTRPNVSFQGDESSNLDIRFTNYISYVHGIKPNTDVIVEALYNQQGKNFEMIPHVSLRYYFDKSENKAVLGGLCFRTRDAVIARLGYTHKTLQAGISYDINISSFTPATNRRGGFEIFVNYIIKLEPSFIARKRPCPVYL